MTYNPIIPVIPVLVVFLVLLAVYSVGVMREDKGIGYKILRILRIMAVLGVIFVIDLRPQTKRYNVDIEMKNIDVLFVVDTTISMWAEDYDGKNPRMEGVMDDCKYIIDSLNGSNFALIRFDNRSQILAPFTQDSKNVLDAFSTIKAPDRYYAKGTTLNTPYEDMELLLRSSSKKEDRITVVFFISDGEITDESALRSFKNLESYVNSGAVLGYGTADGGKMYDKNNYSYVKDNQTGGDAISKYDEATLRQLAEDLDIDYIHMDKKAYIEYLLDNIKNGSVAELASSDAVSYEDVYYYYAVPLLILLILELIIISRKGRL